MKKVIFLFSIILMLGFIVNTTTKAQTSNLPCIATVYLDPNEEFVFDCSGYNMQPFNNPYVTFEMNGNQVAKIIIHSGTLDLIAMKNDTYDLPVIINGGSGYNARIHIIFVK